MKDKDETACEDSRKSIPSRGNSQCKGPVAEVPVSPGVSRRVCV